MIVPDYNEKVPVISLNGSTSNITPVKFVNGQTYELYGKNLGTKPAPIKFTKVNDMENNSLLEANDSDWIHYYGSGAKVGAEISDVNPRYTGSKHISNDTSRNGFDTNYHTFDPQEEIFLSYWYSIDGAEYSTQQQGGGTYLVEKRSRITSSSAAGGDGVYNGTGQHGLQGANPAYSTIPGLTYSNGNETSPSYYVNVPHDPTWHRIDTYVRLSDPDLSNGQYDCKVWEYGEYIGNNVNDRISDHPYQLDSVILGVMFANHSGPDIAMRVNDVYIDNTRMRVELCDSPDYSASTSPEIQPTITWIDGKIEIQANTGRYSPGVYYLHVIDANGDSALTKAVEII